MKSQIPAALGADLMHLFRAHAVRLKDIINGGEVDPTIVFTSNYSALHTVRRLCFEGRCQKRQALSLLGRQKKPFNLHVNIFQLLKKDKIKELTVTNINKK